MDEHEEQVTWPPPVERVGAPPPAVSAGHRRIIGMRWHYTVMAAVSVWLFRLHWRKFGGPVLNFDTLGDWICVPLFCGCAAQAWVLYLRTKHGR